MTVDLEAARIKLSALNQDLEDWYATLTNKIGHFPLETPPNPESSITNGAEGRLFDTFLGDENLEIASAFMNHHAIKISALEWKHKLNDLS
jgi:hypothetical protein